MGSYIKALVSDVIQPSVPANGRPATLADNLSISCQHSLPGDDVFLMHLPNLMLETRNNDLLRHVQRIVESSSLNPVSSEEPFYSEKDIAILVDQMSDLATKECVTLFRNVFKTFWPEGCVQAAGTYPRKGVIIDSLDNFAGLEAKVVLFVLANRDKWLSNRTITNPRYLVAIASRGIDRVDFIQEDPISLDVAKIMKYDQVSAIPM